MSAFWIPWSNLLSRWWNPKSSMHGEIMSDVLNACDKMMKPSRLLIQKYIAAKRWCWWKGSPGSVFAKRIANELLLGYVQKLLIGFQMLLNKVSGRSIFPTYITSPKCKKLPVKTLGWEMGDYFPFKKGKCSGAMRLALMDHCYTCRLGEVLFHPPLWQLDSPNIFPHQAQLTDKLFSKAR